MTLSEAVATQSPALRLWVLWLTVVIVAAPPILLVFRQSRRDGVVMLVASAGTLVFMQLLYAQVGFVRLLGLPHVLIWTPLAVYLGLRLRKGRLTGLPRVTAWVALLTILISLAFDYVDVARWILGERAPMTAQPA